MKTKHGSMEDLSFLAAECDHLNRALDGAQEKATQTKIIHEEEKGKLRNEIAEAREELKKQRQSFEERIEKVAKLRQQPELSWKLVPLKLGKQMNFTKRQRQRSK